MIAFVRTQKSMMLVTGLMLGFACLLFRRYLEGVMLTHMLVQIPLLFLSGVFCSYALADVIAPVWLSLLRNFNAYGIAGLFALLFISAYWMIPRALEECLTAPWAEAFKFISLIALGIVLPHSMMRANWRLQFFFLGYFCSMAAIVGMMYQDAPQRLCNAYLIDDQIYTGIGLVIVSLCIPLSWCVWLASVKHSSLLLKNF